MSSKFRNLILILVLVTVGVCAVTGPAQAQSGACSAEKAKKEMVKARQTYREAHRVWCSTKKFSRLHGPDVGRWVRLARDCGWPWSAMEQLMAIVYRESRGQRSALNESSGAAGLLQFMPQWYHGEWGYPAFDPFDAKANLKAGYWLWKHESWEPWSL